MITPTTTSMIMSVSAPITESLVTSIAMSGRSETPTTTTDSRRSRTAGLPGLRATIIQMNAAAMTPITVRKAYACGRKAW
ncbi:hypothetical protein SAMN05216195_11759 [Lentzea flaviverrucosa]|uniref:Uncharacterized protein n=1 Tax=Lentzea flaviverrucosa TaxID=200379 RepID=A0A1H9XSC6_9PSEU|nr:hypothetical protein SAMN05216195_11759 [Lentzea flaviverrucosa]